MLEIILSATLAAATPTSDPFLIYAAAMQKLATLPEPAYIDATQRVVVTSATNYNVHDQRGLFRSSDRRENILTVPYSPRVEAFVGDSYFAPDAWLVHHTGAATLQSAGSLNPDLSDLKVIANVVSVNKGTYDISLVGVEPLSNGGSAYHLDLRPRSDPIRHNLRELWVNTQTNDIARAVLVGNYRPTFRDALQLTTAAEDFGQVGPYRLVIHYHCQYGGGIYGTRFDYDSTSEQMSFPACIPGWYFDSAEFARHRNEVNTDSKWSDENQSDAPC